MDRLEFAARLAAYKKDTTREGVRAMALIFGVPIVMAILAPYIAVSGTAIALVLTAYFVMFIGCTRVVNRKARESVRRNHLICTFCGFAWTNTMSSQIVMATGHCGHRGNRVLEED